MKDWFETTKLMAMESLDLGKKLDLNGISYGLPHPHENLPMVPYTYPANYYFFLAGFVRRNNCRRILEIGTWMGGSALAMARGLPQPHDGTELIVTVDRHDLSDDALAGQPLIKKVQGEADDVPIIRQVLQITEKKPIDLLFIDADHEYKDVAKQLGIYMTFFSPKYVLLDDISLNDSMKTFWNDLGRFRKIVNLSEISNSIRDQNTGFGLIDLTLD